MGSVRKNDEKKTRGVDESVAQAKRWTDEGCSEVNPELMSELEISGKPITAPAAPEYPGQHPLYYPRVT